MAKANAVANGSGVPGLKARRAPTSQTQTQTAATAIGPSTSAHSTKTSRSTTPKKLKSLRAATVREVPATANQTQTTPSTPTPSGLAKLFGRGTASKRHHKQGGLSADLPPEGFAAAGDRRPRHGTCAGTGEEDSGQLLLINLKRTGGADQTDAAAAPSASSSGRNPAFSKSAPQSRKMSADANSSAFIEAFTDLLGATEDSSHGSEHDDASLEHSEADDRNENGTLTKQKSLDRGTDDKTGSDSRPRMPRSATGYSPEERQKQTQLLKIKFLNQFDAFGLSPADASAMPLDDPSAFQATSVYGTMSRSALHHHLRSSLENSALQPQPNLNSNLNHVSHSRSGSDVPPQPQARRGSAVDSNKCEDAADALLAMSGSVYVPSGRLDDIVLPVSPSKQVASVPASASASAPHSKRTSSLEPDSQRDLLAFSPSHARTFSRCAPGSVHAEIYDTALALQRLKTPIDMSAALHSAKPTSAVFIPKPTPPVPFAPSRNFPKSSLSSNIANPTSTWDSVGGYSTMSGADSAAARAKLSSALSTPRRLLPAAPKLSENDPSVAFATKARGNYERHVLGSFGGSASTTVSSAGASTNTPAVRDRDPNDSVDLTDGRSVNSITSASSSSIIPHCDIPPDQQSVAGIIEPGKPPPFA